MSPHKDTYNSSQGVKISTHFYYHAEHSYLFMSCPRAYISNSLLHITTRYPKYTWKKQIKIILFLFLQLNHWLLNFFPGKWHHQSLIHSKSFRLEISISYDSVKSGSLPVSQNPVHSTSERSLQICSSPPLNLDHHHFLPKQL